jgi:hypothetical protein
VAAGDLVGAPHVTPGRLHWLILDVGVRRPDQPWRWPAWLRPTAGELTWLTELLRHNEHPVWPGDAAVADAFARLGEAVEAERTRWVRPARVRAASRRASTSRPSSAAPADTRRASIAS